MLELWFRQFVDSTPAAQKFQPDVETRGARRLQPSEAA